MGRNLSPWDIHGNMAVKVFFFEQHVRAPKNLVTLFSTFHQQTSFARSIRMPLSQRRATGSSVRGKRLRKLTNTRYGMTASRIMMSRDPAAVETDSMKEITVICTKMTRIRIMCREEKRPSRSNGSSSRALNWHRSSKRLTRSTFMGRSIGTILQTMKIWVQLYYQ